MHIFLLYHKIIYTPPLASQLIKPEARISTISTYEYKQYNEYKQRPTPKTIEVWKCVNGNHLILSQVLSLKWVSRQDYNEKYVG